LEGERQEKIAMNPILHERRTKDQVETLSIAIHSTRKPALCSFFLNLAFSRSVSRKWVYPEHSQTITNVNPAMAEDDSEDRFGIVYFQIDRNVASMSSFSTSWQGSTRMARAIANFNRRGEQSDHRI
jgi:hypothetical protein